MLYFFLAQLSVPGRGRFLPRNPRLGFKGGLSNPFWAKIGSGIQWWYSGSLKVPGTPLDFRILVWGFQVLVHLEGNLVIFPHFTVSKPQL